MDVVARTNAYTFQDQPAHFDLNDAAQGEAIPPNTGALPSAAVSVSQLIATGLTRADTPIPAGQENRPPVESDSYVVPPALPPEWEARKTLEALFKKEIWASRGTFPTAIPIPGLGLLQGGAFAIIMDQGDAWNFVTGKGLKSAPTLWVGLKFEWSGQTKMLVASITLDGSASVIDFGLGQATYDLASLLPSKISALTDKVPVPDGISRSASWLSQQVWLFANERVGLRDINTANDPAVANDGTAGTAGMIFGALARIPGSKELMNGIGRGLERVGTNITNGVTSRANAGASTSVTTPAASVTPNGAMAQAQGRTWPGAVAIATQQGIGWLLRVVGEILKLNQGIYYGPGTSARVDVRLPDAPGRSTELTFTGPGGVFTTDPEGLSSILGEMAKNGGDTISSTIGWDGPSNLGRSIYGSFLGNPEVKSFNDVLNTPYFKQGNNNYVDHKRLQFAIEAAIENRVLDPFKLVIEAAQFLAEGKGTLLQRQNARAVMFMPLNGLLQTQLLVRVMLTDVQAAPSSEVLKNKIENGGLLMPEGALLTRQGIPDFLEDLKEKLGEEIFTARLKLLSERFKAFNIQQPGWLTEALEKQYPTFKIYPTPAPQVPEAFEV
jgi:hypothetical protein